MSVAFDNLNDNLAVLVDGGHASGEDVGDANDETKQRIMAQGIESMHAGEEAFNSCVGEAVVDWSVIRNLARLLELSDLLRAKGVLDVVSDEVR